MHSGGNLFSQSIEPFLQKKWQDWYDLYEYFLKEIDEESARQIQLKIEEIHTEYKSKSGGHTLNSIAKDLSKCFQERTQLKLELNNLNHQFISLLSSNVTDSNVKQKKADLMSQMEVCKDKANQCWRNIIHFSAVRTALNAQSRENIPEIEKFRNERNAKTTLIKENMRNAYEAVIRKIQAIQGHGIEIIFSQQVTPSGQNILLVLLEDQRVPHLFSRSKLKAAIKKTLGAIPSLAHDDVLNNEGKESDPVVITLNLSAGIPLISLIEGIAYNLIDFILNPATINSISSNFLMFPLPSVSSENISNNLMQENNNNNNNNNRPK